MEFIEVIKKYLQDKAPLHELNQVDRILTEKLKQTPKLEIDRDAAEKAIIRKCNEMWNGENKLSVLKFFKEMTGMGLKESKDWCDTNIFTKEPS
jgi:ribosomal protein L7/L12